MSYVAPSYDALDFAIGSEENIYTPPDFNAVHFAILGDVTMTADAPLVFVANIDALGPVYAVGIAFLVPDTVIDANAPPAGPTDAAIKFTALGQGASGQPAEAVAVMTMAASATGKVAYFGVGAATASMIGAGNVGVGVGGTCAALLAFDPLAQGSATESYWGEVNAPLPLGAYATGSIPQAEVCA